MVAIIGSVVLAINLALAAADSRPSVIGAAAILGWLGLTLLTLGVTLRLWSIFTLGVLFTFAVTI
jgi:hypothetical protein